LWPSIELRDSPVLHGIIGKELSIGVVAFSTIGSLAKMMQCPIEFGKK
jgi:hypothetical protein